MLIPQLVALDLARLFQITTEVRRKEVQWAPLREDGGGFLLVVNPESRVELGQRNCACISCK